MYYFLAIGVLTLILMIAYKGLKHEEQHDSALKRRAVMSANEQLFFSRLKQVFPEFNVLARVSFDALLTTKFLRTRHKYRSMVADFVVLDQAYNVLAIIAFTDLSHARRIHNDAYQDNLLQLAGYRVIRYDTIPEQTHLREQLEHDLRPVLPPLSGTFAVEDRALKFNTVSNLKV